MMMSEDKSHKIKKSITRRKFVIKSAIALTALGAAGISGYSILNDDKTRLFLNYHRMGHCAPSIMQTLLEYNNIHNPELVKITGAMAGGIAGPEMECGALTAPLMFLGFQKGIPADINEKLLFITQIQSYYNKFYHYNGSTICTNIRDRHDGGCWKAISGFYNEFTSSRKNPLKLPAEMEKSYSILLNAFNDNGFHCAHNVLERLKMSVDIKKELYDASWPFIGGIAMLNRTCGALAAGVMALSSSLARIETSFFRVQRMNKLLKENDDNAMNDDINNFNKAINAGRELGTWFRKEFRSTTCLSLCGYNFSQTKDANNYLSDGCMNHCSLIAEKVAGKVKSILSSNNQPLNS